MWRMEATASFDVITDMYLVEVGGRNAMQRHHIVASKLNILKVLKISIVKLSSKSTSVVPQGAASTIKKEHHQPRPFLSVIRPGQLGYRSRRMLTSA